MFAATFATPPALGTIAQHPLDTARSDSPRAIAIDGVDGVGRTTFVDATHPSHAHVVRMPGTASIRG